MEGQTEGHSYIYKSVKTILISDVSYHHDITDILLKVVLNTITTQMSVSIVII